MTKTFVQTTQLSLPAYAFGQAVHLFGFLIRLRLAQAVVELHQQPLSKRLSCTINASVVKHFGVLPADAHGISGATVQVGALALLSLEGHPAKRCTT